jgi:hypothetical protein
MGNARLVKVVLPANIVDGMDELLARQVGGLQSRSEFIREALDSYITELRFHDSTDGVPYGVHAGLRAVAAPAAERAIDAPQAQPLGVLEPSRRPVLLLDGEGVVNNAPLFFHNRDYASLWAALALAEISDTRLLSLDAAIREITKRAWKFGDLLQTLPPAELKPTVLFPTNRDKHDASEAAFRAFALGSCQEVGAQLRCEGPLFGWGLWDVKKEGGSVLVGITKDGWSLLSALHGLSPQMPHSQQAAQIFLDHLQEHATSDRWGFDAICNLVATSPTREQLLKAFAREASGRNYRWTTHQVANFASGYISRGREWGLITPKQVSGTYALTDFGRSFVARRGAAE